MAYAGEIEATNGSIRVYSALIVNKLTVNSLNGFIAANVLIKNIKVSLEAEVVESELNMVTLFKQSPQTEMWIWSFQRTQ